MTQIERIYMFAWFWRI